MNQFLIRMARENNGLEKLLCQYNDKHERSIFNMYGPYDHFEEERSHALGALIKKYMMQKKKQKNY